MRGVKWVGGFGLCAVLGFGGYSWWMRDDGAGVPDALRQAGGGSSGVGEGAAREVSVVDGGLRPLFRFGHAYLDGRSHWLREKFLAGRRAFFGAADVEPGSVQLGSEYFECEVVVHREPFTEGDWMAALGEDSVELRELTEKQTVEARVEFRVDGVEPRRLLAYIAASDYRSRLDDGRVLVEWTWPGDEAPVGCVEPLPPLNERRFLTHETWSRALAKPTDVWFINELFVEEEGPSLVYEAWRNCGDEGHATVRLASGNYRARAVEGGSILSIHTFYSGQAIPPMMQAIVRRMTTSYFRTVAKTFRKNAPDWQPLAAAARLFGN